MPQWDREASSYAAIGQRLSHMRHALGLSQRQLADQLQITHPRWANYEIGTSRIPVDVALQLVERWDVSLDWVYYGNAAMMPKQLLKAIRVVAKKAPNSRVRSSKT